MVKVYFEIFGTKLVKMLDDKKYETMTKDQIEYYVRGQLKVNKINVEKTPETNNPLDYLNDIFRGFTK